MDTCPNARSALLSLYGRPSRLEEKFVWRKDIHDNFLKVIEEVVDGNEPIAEGHFGLVEELLGDVNKTRFQRMSWVCWMPYFG